MVVLWFKRMQYFIREPGKQALFDVVPNVYWILLKSNTGCLLHILLAILTICLLVGVKKTEAMVARYKEKIMVPKYKLLAIKNFIAKY